MNDPLAKRLDYVFTDPSLRDAALTHRSAGPIHNERLEFLGDSVLNFVIAAALFERSPQAPEGDLSRLRAALVRERTLAQIASEIELGSELRMGSGELRSGGFRRASILADALEALFGGIFLDAGFDRARAVILHLFAQRLDNLPSADTLKDAKTRLQEQLQACGRALPNYELVEVTGQDHAQRFVARCKLSDTDQTTTGEGRGRRRAEQAAAAAMLEQLTHE